MALACGKDRVAGSFAFPFPRTGTVDRTERSQQQKKKRERRNPFAQQGGRRDNVARDCMSTKICDGLPALEHTESERDEDMQEPHSVAPLQVGTRIRLGGARTSL